MILLELCASVAAASVVRGIEILLCIHLMKSAAAEVAAVRAGKRCK